MMNSIRSYLVIMLIAAFALVSFLASLNGYLSSMDETKKLLDMQLLRVSDILMSTDNADSAMLSTGRSDGRLVFQVWQAGQLLVRSQAAPESPINEFVTGFRHANFSGYRWRTLTRVTDNNRWYILAERTDLRHLVAEKAVLKFVVPLLLWLPVAAALIWILVSWGLRPLRDLSRQINLKRSDDLEPLNYPNPPRELIELLDSTNSLLNRLSAAFDREKHFASHAAHDLRTPLSVLKVHLHNLAQELPPGHSGLAHANEGVERMHHLVEQILNVHRTNPEIIKANFQPLNLHLLAQRVTASAWPAFEARKQTLSLSGESVTISGDEALLEILLQNLLDNARKYTPDGGEIKVYAGPAEPGLARLCVQDSGPGIAPNQRQRVFERSYRLDSDTGDGSGLGLAIVKHVVQLHNANCVLSRSTFSTGLAVTVDFPNNLAAPL